MGSSAARSTEPHNAFRQSCSKEEDRHQSQGCSWCEEDNQDEGSQEKASKESCGQKNKSRQGFRSEAKICAQKEGHQGRKEEMKRISATMISILVSYTNYFPFYLNLLSD